MDCPGQACSKALTKRVIAFAWAVEPLAFRVGLPPQITFAGDVPVVALPPVVLLSPPHADNIAAPAARILSVAPNRLSLNQIPLRGTDEMIAGGLAGAMRHSNKRSRLRGTA